MADARASELLRELAEHYGQDFVLVPTHELRELVSKHRAPNAAWPVELAAIVKRAKAHPGWEGIPRRRLVRALVIPPGAEEDAEGRGIGSDWLLGSLGQDLDGNTVYLTTDRLHGTDVPGWLEDPARLAAVLVEAINSGVLRGAL